MQLLKPNPADSMGYHCRSCRTVTAPCVQLVGSAICKPCVEKALALFAETGTTPTPSTGAVLPEGMEWVEKHPLYFSLYDGTGLCADVMCMGKWWMWVAYPLSARGDEEADTDDGAKCITGQAPDEEAAKDAALTAAQAENEKLKQAPRLVWYPVSDAPSDYDEYTVWVGGGERNALYHWPKNGTPGWFYYDRDEDRLVQLYPTHWRHMSGDPNAPAALAPASEGEKEPKPAEEPKPYRRTGYLCRFGQPGDGFGAK